METTTVLLIAIPVLVVLAGVLLFASARRRDTGEAIGALARETRKRDRGAGRPRRRRRRARPPAARSSGPPPSSSREASHGRSPRSAPSRRSPGCRPTPRSSASPAASSSTAAIVTFFGLGLAGFGAALLAFLWPQLGGGFGSVINVGNDRRHRRQDRRGRRASPTTPRAACGSPSTRRRRSATAKAVYSRARARRAWRPGSPRSTRSACTSAAACRSA